MLLREKQDDERISLRKGDQISLKQGSDKSMMFFSLKHPPCAKAKRSWTFRWFMVLTLVSLTLLMTLLSACDPPSQLTQNRLSGVAEVSPTDIWAVGNMTSSKEASFQGQILIEHWNGQQWTTVPSSLNGSLSGIAAIASNDIWAVGTSGGSLLTMHWDGARWSQVIVPDASAGFDTGLSAVAAVSSHDVWVAGQQQNLPVLLHWDGQAWHPMPLTTSPVLRLGGVNALQVVSATDIWAGGWYSKPDGSPKYTLAEHWDGKNWRVVPTPEFTTRYPPNQSLADATFSSLTALSSNNVWAVGNSDPHDGTGSPSRTLVEHWDGTQWEIVDTPAAAKTDDSYPQSIFAVNARDIWIAGYRYSKQTFTNYPLLLHWNGQSWQIATPPAIKDTSCEFYAGTALASNDLWLVGSSGGAAPPAPSIGDNTAQTLVEHWNGTGWTHVLSPSPGQPVTVPAG